MILDTVHLCYDPSHRPFSSDGAVKIQNLDSQKPASKMIRAVLRVDGLDASGWEDYSLHRCYCKSKRNGAQEVDDLVDPTLTLDELGIGEGHRLFIRKRSGTDKLKEGSPSISASSRKRKRDQDVDDSLPSILSIVSNSRATASSTKSLNAPAAQVSSNLENLTSQAASAAASITKLLGGDQWKIQSIGKFGIIKTRGRPSLQALQRLVRTSLKIPQVSNQEPGGLFNSDLVEALTRAFHQRIATSTTHPNNHFFDLGVSDFERANELLRGKVEQDGSWERSSIHHLDESALVKPELRFPLSDSGLSGKHLSAARAVSALWNNDKWINQVPLPGLSAISLKDDLVTTNLRLIAHLTRVKPGEATSDGFPPIVLEYQQPKGDF